MNTVAMEQQLKHFSHEHLLNLVQLQPDRDNVNSDEEDEHEDENEDKDDIVVEEVRFGECNMCKEEIYSFQLCYYSCKDCDYNLHRFCAELPETQQNHPLHPGHNLTLTEENPSDNETWKCSICRIEQSMSFYKYICPTCEDVIDIVCATMYAQKMDHPSHPHQLQRCLGRMTSHCNACGNEHSGTFYHCTSCSLFKIHLDCALLPAKLLIQQSTNESFSHSHLLNLVYSFPLIEQKAKFFPSCRVCNISFLADTTNTWHYRCDKCRYYAHVDCASSRKEAFMSSILMPAGMGKTYKNYRDEDHPNLICCPFPDESVNLLKHLFINKGEIFMKEKIAGEMFSHPHPLILVDTLHNGPVSLHDPMKKVELLCDGCVRPVTSVPFYKCCQQDCGFVLHEWCTRLPSEIQHHPCHPEHKLVLLPKFPEDMLGVFWCKMCGLTCNGFAYGCKECEDYYVDINCGLIPDVITHEAHPNHLLTIFKANSSETRQCKACQFYISREAGFYHCPTCDFNLDIGCALLLPGRIRHKYDKHALSLRYHPAENHIEEYFCEICEEHLNPEKWFYHCSVCAWSMHTACAPVKLQCERSVSYKGSLFNFLNVKFGGRHEIKNHPHPLIFLQAIEYDGKCVVCHRQLKSYDMMLKCIRCKFALHCDGWCEKMLIEGSASSSGG
ncbi:hypothetical protein M8C21_031112, partial [Ambrosia artemisiifolia]